MRKAVLMVIFITAVLFLVVSCGNLKIGEKRVELTSPKNGAREVDLKPVLAWSLVSPFAFEGVKYDLYISGNSEPLLYKSNLIETFYTVEEPLSPNKTYYWKVVAKIDGEVVESRTWNFTTINDSPPSPPSLLLPMNNTIVSVDVNFEWGKSMDRDGDAISYDLYLATDNTFSSPVSISGLDSTGLKLTLYPNTIYFWKVAAVDEKGMEAESVVYTFKTKDAPPIKPFAIYPEDGQEGVSTPVKLMWYSEDPEGSSLVYDVYLGESSDSLAIATHNISESSYEITQDLKSNTEYYWQVIAIDPSSNTSESDIFSFKTQ